MGPMKRAEIPGIDVVSKGFQSLRPIAMKIAMLIFIAMDRNGQSCRLTIDDHKREHTSVMAPYVSHCT